jgi:hypothetical protein
VTWASSAYLLRLGDATRSSLKHLKITVTIAEGSSHLFWSEMSQVAQGMPKLQTLTISGPGCKLDRTQTEVKASQVPNPWEFAVPGTTTVHARGCMLDLNRLNQFQAIIDISVDGFTSFPAADDAHPRIVRLWHSKPITDDLLQALNRTFPNLEVSH